uniref:Uncharacterized protein n=1 Tax=Rhizophora mucronata TaxID=61149 RepID=A0A2P2NAJ3_RHIMU
MNSIKFLTMTLLFTPNNKTTEMKINELIVHKLTKKKNIYIINKNSMFTTVAPDPTITHRIETTKKKKQKS